MRAFLKKILPSFIIESYKNSKKKQRAKELEEQKAGGNILQQRDVEDQLKKMGIKAGDVVMLHSSLSKIGFVEGGANTVINAFLNIVGSTGTLVMPSFPAIGFNYDYLKENPKFDAINTVSKMGVITEVFRKMSGVKRSLHPTDPVTAFGLYAENIVSGHYGQLTPYSANSPFYKLCELNAKIVLIGVDLNSLTNLHTLEDAVDNFKFPVYHSRIFECDIIDEKGIKSKVKTKAHDPKWSKQRKCNELILPFKQAGFMKEGKLGKATVYSINAKQMHEWMVINYNERGITMYTPQGS